MKNKKTIIITAAAIIIIAGGCWIFGGTKAKNKIDFVTEQVQKGNVSNSITATGTIEPVRHSCISPWQYNHVIQRS